MVKIDQVGLRRAQRYIRQRKGSRSNAMIDLGQRREKSQKVLVVSGA